MSDTNSGTGSGTPPPFEDCFKVDRRNLPDTFKPKRFLAAIRERFEDRELDIDVEPNGAHAAYVAGSLLQASYYDAAGPGFSDAFVEMFDLGYTEADTVKKGDRILYQAVYQEVADEVRRLKGGRKPTVQEVAGVSDDVIDRGPVDDNFATKVRSAFDDFVSRTPVYDTLVLPDVVTDETARAEVEAENVRGVAMVYATSELELADLFMAVDAAAQDWSDGVLPVDPPAGRLFDEYVWGANERLAPAARQIQYDRIGELGGYLLRFCSATSEFDRSRYLSEYLLPTSEGRGRTPQPRDAAVRKSARDLLAYASLHGWAYTQFAARRLGNQIRQCVDIIEHPEVQKAYSAQGPWQVVERISLMTTGRTPDIAKHRALASTGKEIMDILASKAIAIVAALSKDPLFPPAGLPVDGNGNGNGHGHGNRGHGQGKGVRSVFTIDEYGNLLNLVESWLAANAIGDDARLDAAQPRDVATSPSIPAFGGNGNGLAGFDSDAVKNQLMQMVSSGQMPTADQVNQLFGVGR